MNQTQKKYALERVEYIRRNKNSELENKYTTPKKQLSGDEMINLVVKKKVPIRKDISRNTYRPELKDVFDFSNYESPKVIDSKKLSMAIKPINEKAQKIKDQIMLGDAEEALKMIQDFENQ